MSVPYFDQIVLGAGGFLYAFGTNWINKKPPLTGVYRHIAYAVLGFVAGKYLAEYRIKKKHEKMVFIEDYVESHPEHFPESTPLKWKDVFQTWHPTR
ncbi:hypothetical protein CHS0354_026260 [Potamilus streckersoni]|uniref:NADH dehydrogenase [ubiquinone] 1 subunit C2 n=1 Tax=Potamilus streckersoni TaxID=2493646 RepID=A0AAE0T6C0_9BIVA|nr:hypothetical protein CHS0354_026260 [Potamilus streckersoni]